jgi:hypothetical protein
VLEHLKQDKVSDDTKRKTIELLQRYQANASEHPKDDDEVAATADEGESTPLEEWDV